MENWKFGSTSWLMMVTMLITIILGGWLLIAIIVNYTRGGEEKFSKEKQQVSDQFTRRM